MTHRIRSLLWADDDVKRRFIYTKYRLEKNGWKVILAPSVLEAAEELRKTAFDFILFDQMYPFSQTDNIPDVWGGCRLFYWLKGKKLPRSAPPSNEIDRLKDLKPKKSNKKAPVMFLSAFDDEAVRKAILDLKHPGLRMETKPMHTDVLISVLEELTEG